MQVRFLGQEDTLEEENGNLLQYFCQKNSMHRGHWQAIAQGSQESNTTEWLMHACMHRWCVLWQFQDANMHFHYPWYRINKLLHFLINRCFIFIMNKWNLFISILETIVLHLLWQKIKQIVTKTRYFHLTLNKSRRDSIDITEAFKTSETQAHCNSLNSFSLEWASSSCFNMPARALAIYIIIPGSKSSLKFFATIPLMIT